MCASSSRPTLIGLVRSLPSVAAALGALLVAPAAFPAPLIVTIGNGPSSQSGDYINAVDFAHTLAFTSVTILADEIVRVETDVDLSVSPLFGPTLFDVYLQAPERVEVMGDLRLGAGSVTLTAPEVRLEGILLDADANPLDQTRMQSSATRFLVGAEGSVQQASLMAFENPSLPTEIVVDGASDSNLVNVWNNVHLELRSGFVENLTLLAAGSLLDWRGGQVGETGLFGFGGTIRIHGSQFERGPYTVCSGIPPSGWTPAPPSLTNVGACLRGVLASGEPFMVIVNFGGTIEFVQASPPIPVPGPGWWLAPMLVGGAWAGLGRCARIGDRPDRASPQAP